MKFSPFNPVLFGVLPFTDFPNIFSVNDCIMIECFMERGESLPGLSLVKENDETVYNLDWNILTMGNQDMAFYMLRDMDPGCYVFNCGNLKSNTIIVTDKNDLLSETVLLQYYQNDNRSRSDIVTRINRNNYFFDFRIPGGFKDCNWEFSVDNEQFETEDSDIVELYSVDSTSKKLTIGTSAGIPLWFGEMVNRALSCDFVYIDGQRFSRDRSSVPQSIGGNGNDRFVFNVSMQQNSNLNIRDLKDELFNQIILRRTPSNLRRMSSAGWRKI